MKKNIHILLIDKITPVLSEPFKGLFILLPIYIALSILLWGGVWSGYIQLPIQNILVWHIYEMMFGAVSAGMIGFILTFIPEIYEDSTTISKTKVLGIISLWVIGRITFWMIDVLGVYFVAITNIALLVWIIVLVAKPLILDPQRRHLSLAIVFIAIVIIQAWFFASIVGWADADALSILKVALGGFMILELLALRRIATGTINEWLEYNDIDDIFIAKPPRYNIAILCVILFTLIEFLFPNNPTLAWIGLAVFASTLNILNDFFITSRIIIFKAYVFPLFLIIFCMSLGYGLMGYDYLDNGFYGMNHFRHFLTSGVLGLSLFMVMVIIGTIHTGRHLISNKWINIAVALIIIATLLRSTIPFFPTFIVEENLSLIYLSSSVIWATAFIIYLIVFFPILSIQK
jgi:uncharacterized protein involved in response to NO